MADDQQVNKVTADGMIVQQKILCVDDDDGQRYAIGRILRQANFQTIEATDAATAWQAALTQPALILLDVHLPDDNGYAICRRLKADPRTCNIPVLLISAVYKRSSDRVLGLDGGADGYLVNPIQPAELIATVRALLRVYQAEAEARAAQAHLAQVNQQLELRVETRTAELVETNRQLQAEINARTATQASLIRSRGQLRALTARMQQLQEQERKRIARELHDELGQALTALKIDLDWLSTARAAARRTKIGRMKQLIDELIRDVRRIIGELRPPLLDDLGLVAALEWAVTNFAQRTGIDSKVSLPNTDLVLPLDMATAIYRIVQEALTNIARHAAATSVVVHLSIVEQTLWLTIVDNGRGFTETTLTDSPSLGLIGIKERALLWQGVAEITGLPDKGTTVQVRLPIPK